MADDQTVSVKIVAAIEGFNAKMAEASAAVKNATGEMKSSLDSVKASVDAVQAAFGPLMTAIKAVGAIMAGGAVFRDAVSETNNLTKESISLGKAFGISASDASVLKIAMDQVGVSQETMQLAANKVSQQLVRNEDAFKDLGVATRDANGNFRSTFDIMQDTNAKLLEFKEGTDRNVEGIKVYGRAWSEIAPTLKLNAAAMADAEEKAKALHIYVGQESVEAARKYRVSMADVNDVLTGLKKAIGDAVMPILTQLGEWFASIGPQAVEIMRGAMIGLTAVWNGFVLVVRTVYDVIVGVVQGMVVSFMTLGDAINKAFHGDISGAATAFRNGWDQIKGIAIDSSQDIVKAYNKAVDDTSAAFDRMLNPETKVQKKEGGLSSEGAAKTDDNKFDTELAKLKEAYDEADRGSQERIRIAEQITDRVIATLGRENATYFESVKREVQASKEAAAELIKDSEAQAKADYDLQLKQLDTTQKILEDEHKLHQISDGQFFDLERVLVEQKKQINADYYSYLQALRDGDKEKQAEYSAKLVENEQATSAQLAKINTDQAAAAEKNLDAMFKPLSKAFDGMFKGIVQGTQTVQQAFQRMAQNILSAVLNMVEQAILNYAKAFIMQKFYAKEGALAKIQADAAAAASGAYQAVVVIPYVGPALAPVAAAGAYVATMAFGSMVSAAGGYDIPSGINPVVQTHANEMILPAKYADVIRSMANGGQGGSVAAPAIHFNVSAMDAKSVKQFFREHSSIIGQTVAGEYHRFSGALR